MYDSIIQEIIGGISDRIRIATKGLNRLQVLLGNPQQVSNIVNNKPTRAYPYLLGKGIIRQLINNPHLPFDSQDEMLWGTHGHEELHWGIMLERIILEYYSEFRASTNKSEDKLIINKVFINDVNYAIYDAVIKYYEDTKTKSSFRRMLIMLDTPNSKSKLPGMLSYGVSKSDIGILKLLQEMFDAPNFKKPNITYMNVKELSTKYFKDTFINNFKKNPLIHFKKNFEAFANRYCKQLFIDCYKALITKPTSFGLQAFKCEYKYLSFIDYFKENQDSLISVFNSKKSMNKALNKYNIYVTSHLSELENLQKMFNL